VSASWKTPTEPRAPLSFVRHIDIAYGNDAPRLVHVLGKEYQYRRQRGKNIDTAERRQQGKYVLWGVYEIDQCLRNMHSPPLRPSYPHLLKKTRGKQGQSR
jgi:hypothetical protein